MILSVATTLLDRNKPDVETESNQTGDDRLCMGERESPSVRVLAGRRMKRQTVEKGGSLVPELDRDGTSTCRRTKAVTWDTLSKAPRGGGHRARPEWAGTWARSRGPLPGRARLACSAHGSEPHLGPPPPVLAKWHGPPPQHQFSVRTARGSPTSAFQALLQKACVQRLSDLQSDGHSLLGGSVSPLPDQGTPCHPRNVLWGADTQRRWVDGLIPTVSSPPSSSLLTINSLWWELSHQKAFNNLALYKTQRRPLQLLIHLASWRLPNSESAESCEQREMKGSVWLTGQMENAMLFQSYTDPPALRACGSNPTADYGHRAPKAESPPWVAKKRLRAAPMFLLSFFIIKHTYRAMKYNVDVLKPPVISLSQHKYFPLYIVVTSPLCP